MLNGTIIFIALILVVACGLLGWLSALLADFAPEAGRKGAQEASTFRLEINSDAVWWLLMLADLLGKQRGSSLFALELSNGHCVQGGNPTDPLLAERYDLSATRRVAGSSMTFSPSELQTFSRASDISRIVSGSNASPERNGRIGTV